MSRSKILFTISIILLLFVMALAVFFGSSTSLDWTQAFEIRGPRALLALGVGAGLAVSGATLQALFANPLCDPYTLGVSSGAALGSVIAAGLGLSSIGVLGSSGGGALLFSIILYFFASKKLDSRGILVFGVMLGFLGQGLVTLWLSFQDPGMAQRVLGWLFGDLSRADWSSGWICLTAALGITLMIFRSHRGLDALLMGDSDASAMGVDVRKLRSTHLLLSALLVSVCVSFAGMIGFLGFLIPHFVRNRVGALHSKVIPFSFIFGGIVLVAADLLARVSVRPYELPVGALTALLGGPFFVLAVIRPRRKGRS